MRRLWCAAVCAILVCGAGLAWAEDPVVDTEAVDKALELADDAAGVDVASAAITCQGSDDKEVDGKSLTGVALGVSMQGSCDVEVVDTTIEATEVGALIQGSGELKIERGSVRAPVAIKIQGSGEARLDGVELEGTEAAIYVMGSGDVYLKNCKVKGKIVTLGGAEIHDEGGNEFSE